MEQFNKKEWIMLWMFPLLFFVAVGVVQFVGTNDSSSYSKQQNSPTHATANDESNQLFTEMPVTTITNGKMDAYIATGFPDKSYNGIYFYIGDYNNKAQYQLDSNHYLTWANGAMVEKGYFLSNADDGDDGMGKYWNNHADTPDDPSGDGWIKGASVLKAVPAFDVSGAGDTEWNGKYFDMGLDKSGTAQHYYQKDEEHRLCWDSIDGWWFFTTIINGNEGATSGAYHSNYGSYKSGGAGTYIQDGDLFTGAAPAPTVTAISSQTSQ